MITLPIISLLVVLSVVALALYGLTVFMLARTLTRPRRLTPARALARVGRMSPSDLSLPFEECKFQVTDQRTGQPLRLAAWWMPLPTSNACAILLHGYADAKIGSIAWAPLLQRLGYNVLAIDLRAHGESEGSDTTAGYFERHDTSQIIDQLKSQRPAQTESIILFGISMGAAVAAATANVRSDLAAIILDSPYARFRDAARLHADLTGLPGESFLALGWKLAKWRTGANLEEVDPACTIPTAKCPVLIIAATRDLLVSPEAQVCLQSSITGRADCSRIWAMEADHVLGYSADPAEYESQMKRFLDDAAGRSGV
jgi:pimeloyl-ACP methyl ester carboxylesterase